MKAWNIPQPAHVPLWMIVSPWSSTNRKKLSGYNGPAIKRTRTHTHTSFPHTGMILEHVALGWNDEKYNKYRKIPWFWQRGRKKTVTLCHKFLFISIEGLPVKCCLANAMHMFYTHIFRLLLFVAGACGKLIQMPADFLPILFFRFSIHINIPCDVCISLCTGQF